MQNLNATTLIASTQTVRRAPLSCLRLVVLVFALTASWQAALADARLIHVPDVLAAMDLPNPPANEDEAAAMSGELTQLPRVIRLQSATDAAPLPCQAGVLPTGSCPPPSEVSFGSSP